MPSRIATLVVRRRPSPLVRYGLIAASVVIIGLGGVGLYRRGEAAAGFNAGRADRVARHLRRVVQRLRRQTRGLTQRLAAGQRRLETDQAAYAALLVVLKRSDQQQMRLREQLGFYRAILGGPAHAGVRIARFRVAADGDYHLVLIRSLANDRTRTAVIHFTVRGRERHHPSVFSYPTAVDRPLAVHFKYFSDTRGRLVLPAGFVPVRVVVSVVTHGRQVRRALLWPTTS